MSAALTYREPYRFSAALLALAMHLLFFFLLYSSFRWQARSPEVFMVEMWESLPEAEVVPEPTPTPPTAAEPVRPPKAVEPVSPPVKADIEWRDKKKKLAKEKAAAKARQEKERRELDEYADRRRQEKQARAMATQVSRYQDKIRDKIRRNIVMPPDVPESAKAEFKVTLLPGGDVMAVELLKSSGNAAYDSAAERAIYKAQPLPMPPDEELQKMFRELRLTIRP